LVAGPSRAPASAADTIRARRSVIVICGWEHLRDVHAGLANGVSQGICAGTGGETAHDAAAVFEAGDAPTSTLGGTMIGIHGRAKTPRRVGAAAVFVLGRTGLEARQAYSDIIPPVKELWNDPIYQKGDPFFGGRRSTNCLFRSPVRFPRAA